MWEKVVLQPKKTKWGIDKVHLKTSEKNQKVSENLEITKRTSVATKNGGVTPSNVRIWLNKFLSRIVYVCDIDIYEYNKIYSFIPFRNFWRIVL